MALEPTPLALRNLEDPDFSYETCADLFLFTSLTAGSSHIITATSRLETILKANKVPFRAVDVATDDKARRIWGRRAGKRRLPGIVQRGEILGDLEQVEEWNEYGEIKENLGGAGRASVLPAVVASAPVVSPLKAEEKKIELPVQAPVQEETQPSPQALLQAQQAALAMEAAAAGKARKLAPKSTPSVSSLKSIRSVETNESSLTKKLDGTNKDLEAPVKEVKVQGKENIVSLSKTESTETKDVSLGLKEGVSDASIVHTTFPDTQPGSREKETESKDPISDTKAIETVPEPKLPPIISDETLPSNITTEANKSVEPSVTFAEPENAPIHEENEKPMKPSNPHHEEEEPLEPPQISAADIPSTPPNKPIQTSTRSPEGDPDFDMQDPPKHNTSSFVALPPLAIRTNRPPSASISSTTSPSLPDPPPTTAIEPNLSPLFGQETPNKSILNSVTGHPEALAAAMANASPRLHRSSSVSEAPLEEVKQVETEDAIPEEDAIEDEDVDEAEEAEGEPTPAMYGPKSSSTRADRETHSKEHSSFPSFSTPSTLLPFNIPTSSSTIPPTTTTSPETRDYLSTGLPISIPTTPPTTTTTKSNLKAKENASSKAEPILHRLWKSWRRKLTAGGKGTKKKKRRSVQVVMPRGHQRKVSARGGV